MLRLKRVVCFLNFVRGTTYASVKCKSGWYDFTMINLRGTTYAYKLY
jgi:hypothetical protein